MRSQLFTLKWSGIIQVPDREHLRCESCLTIFLDSLLSKRTKYLLQIQGPVNSFSWSGRYFSSGLPSSISRTLIIFEVGGSGSEGSGEFAGQNEAEGASQFRFFPQRGWHNLR